MFRTARLLFLFLLLPFLSPAQADSSSHLRVSLLTVGVGDEIYATFGHAGIRITDSVQGTDEVYNYGTFAFGPDFEVKFMRGKLMYFISSQSFRSFIGTYVEEERSVQEQELLLTRPQKEQLYDFLRNNALPENREYKYDFLYDNCATRIRDVFPKTFGPEFRFGQTLPPDSRLTFRQIINVYLRPLQWERLGINLLLGSKVDRRMTNADVMFLPDYLRTGIGNATVAGQKVATAPVVLLTSRHDQPGPPAPDYPMLVLLGVALLTIGGLAYPKTRTFGSIMSGALLIVTGLLGFLMLFMWLGTDHQACQQNWNVLWALPTNLFLPFMRRGKDRYALIAIILLLLSLVLHVAQVQELPLAQLWPLLLALLYIYGMIYRLRNKRVIV